MPPLPDLSFETDAYRQGFTRIAGIDEAGRGCLAGPVVAAAVIFPSGYMIAGVDDSKKLSPARRERIFEIITDKALSIGIGVVDNREIDRINIYNASVRAMKMAVEDLAIDPDYLLIDAVPVKDLPIPQMPIVKGDTISFTIASASIVAKVTRDRLMAEYHESFPEYNFKGHKGYGTREHMEQLRRFGPCSIHRNSFLGKVLMNNRAKGREGEAIAEDYLTAMGYKILEKNFRNRFGEIDLIARDGRTLVFIEVKTRNSHSHGLPPDAVDARKQGRLGKVALSYISFKKISNQPCRFDVLSIYDDRIELFKDAFDLPDGCLW